MDPFTAGAAGAAAGAAGTKAIEWSADKIPDLIKLFKDRRLAFIENEDDVSLVKETRRTAEFKFLKRFAPSANDLVVMQLGIALRNAEADPERVQRLRQAIKTTHGVAGLRLAECVQSGILQLIHDRLLQRGLGESELENTISQIIRDINAYVLFVKEEMDAKAEAQTAKTRVSTEDPLIYVLAARGKARKTCEEIAKTLAVNLPAYQPRMLDQDQFLLLYFFLHPDIAG